jgi:hypothetical protein
MDVKFTTYSLSKINSLGNLVQITETVFGICRAVPSMKSLLTEKCMETVHYSREFIFGANGF